MLMLTTSALTLWVAAFVAQPRKPLPGNEVQEFVYCHLLGRQRLLVLLALGVTLLALLVAVLALPQREHPMLMCSRFEQFAQGAVWLAAPQCDDLSKGYPSRPVPPPYDAGDVTGGR